MQIESQLIARHDGEEYRFTEVTDPEKSNTYVALDRPPEIVMHHIDRDTPYVVYGPGDEEVTRCEVRQPQSDHREIGVAYYIDRRPDIAVVEIEDQANLDSVRELLEEQGHLYVEEIETVYYYPEEDSFEAWFYENESVGDQNYPGLKHRHYPAYNELTPPDAPHEDADEMLLLERYASKLYDDYEPDDDKITSEQLRGEDAPHPKMERRE